jgi:hypothetical protein
MGLGLAVAVEISDLFGAVLRLDQARAGSGLVAVIEFEPIRN